MVARSSIRSFARSLREAVTAAVYGDRCELLCP
jgi:hypothetical protein